MCTCLECSNRDFLKHRCSLLNFGISPGDRILPIHLVLQVLYMYIFIHTQKVSQVVRVYLVYTVYVHCTWMQTSSVYWYVCISVCMYANILTLATERKIIWNTMYFTLTDSGSYYRSHFFLHCCYIQIIQTIARLLFIYLYTKAQWRLVLRLHGCTTPNNSRIVF